MGPMYRVQLTWLVYLSRSAKAAQERQDVDYQLGVFVQDLILPFPPFPGLALCSGKFRTPPIETVTFNYGEETFSCGFADDRTIPSQAEIVARGNNPEWAPTDIYEYVSTTSRWRTDQLIEQGWQHTGVI
jgi:hypothetical protein